MEKKKINQEDLNLNPEYYRNPPGKKGESDKIEELDNPGQYNGETKSEQEGTGTLCISVVLCKETEKNCDLDKTQGKLCVGPTLWAGCVETVQYCASVACFTPSVEYCLVSENRCDVMSDDCAAYSDDCTPSVNLCVKTDKCAEP